MVSSPVAVVLSRIALILAEAAAEKHARGCGDPFVMDSVRHVKTIGQPGCPSLLAMSGVVPDAGWSFSPFAKSAQAHWYPNQSPDACLVSVAFVEF